MALSSGNHEEAKRKGCVSGYGVTLGVVNLVGKKWIKEEEDQQCWAKSLPLGDLMF